MSYIENIIELKNLTFSYNNHSKPALKNINGNIKQGETILLLGESGSGKSTMLRLFNGLVPNFSGGTMSGTYFLYGKDSRILNQQSFTKSCGFVFQDPEKQMIMMTVEREIAFGMENLGLIEIEIKRRLEEVISFFDLQSIRSKTTWELSGGQMQIVALASVMAMYPSILLLDEPTSQLDPIASEHVLKLVQRINEELGITCIIAEHRLEKILPWVDKVWEMEQGELLFQGDVNTYVKWTNKNEYLPAVTRLYKRFNLSILPLTVKHALTARHTLLDTMSLELTSLMNITKEKLEDSEIILTAKKVSYSYKDKATKVISELDLTIFSGKIYAIIGNNGAGKSTLLQLLAGLLTPNQGKIKGNNYMGYLSQNPNDYFLHDRLIDELNYTQQNVGIIDSTLIERVVESLELFPFLNRNPRDLSGGERQRAALAIMLVANPDIFFLDEPTRGLDPMLKKRLGEWILEEKRKGKTQVIVTHDMEFVSNYVDQVVLLAEGKKIAEGSASEILNGGLFYTTQINRLFRNYNLPVLTENELMLDGVVYGV